MKSLIFATTLLALASCDVSEAPESQDASDITCVIGSQDCPDDLNPGAIAPDASIAVPDASIPLADATPVCGLACTEMGGVCVLNECKQPVVLGFPEPFSNNIGGPLPSLLIGFSIEVIEPSYVTDLGFVALPPPSAGNEADANIALYSDSSGVPADLLLAMDLVVDMAGQTSVVHEQNFTSPILLSPGTYWLMGKSVSTTSPFASNSVVNAQGFPTFPMALVAGDGAAPFPATLAGVTLNNNHAPNFFARLLPE